MLLYEAAHARGKKYPLSPEKDRFLYIIRMYVYNMQRGIEFSCTREEIFEKRFYESPAVSARGSV